MATKEEGRCHISHPALPHTLSRRTGKNPRSSCFSCGKRESDWSDHFHYHCKICDVKFHAGCQNIPRKITHPFHLQHPLTLTDRNYETKILSDTTYQGKSEPVDINVTISEVIFDKCTWCSEKLGAIFYRCSLCSFGLDISCAINVPVLTIANPKSHHHSLVFFPRPLLVPCDACGLVDKSEPSYVCSQCSYIVHQSCIDLPRVIKITRHPHRLSHTPYPPPTILSCRICYKKVDIKYGNYSCNHDDCSYVVHSKCATHEEVWDGEELEWEPEEPDQTEDIAPFKRVGVDLIKHFSHDNCLKLEKFDGLRDTKKQCQACVLPINSHDFYNCVECEFFLHEVCAGLLRKLDHALHNHSLVVDTSPLQNLYSMNCSTCFRALTGFRYKCAKKDCMIGKHLQFDVRCILIPDCFTHQSHEHPVFISSTYSGFGKTLCKGCKEICYGSYLHCTLCEFALCFQCATIPNEIYYKYDEHLLFLSYGEDTYDTYWCEICEKKVDPTQWFYSCNKCCITIHRKCVFGSSVYMKPSFTFYYNSAMVEVVRNGISTRPICRQCNHRCPDSVYYRSGETANCSLQCLSNAKWDKLDEQPT
ncbi:hypothetical protein AALP_AA3G146500 [Arabis alpina]|uniref:Phorbol-ester/DAG-type domain-containing protein n=1 Tax=Arabis alpina TaxID=50452 RepID=A0A087H978_ARAAL|nr:hypothetical protein AALP_AA3G146500 [Arabis alpina]